MRGLLLLCALFAAGCYDSRFGERGGDAYVPLPTTTIGELNALFTGETFLVTGDVVVTGRVTANGRGDNFYRTICIEHNGAGMEILAGADQLHNDFPEGASISLRLKGLALGKSYGVLQTGVMPLAGSGLAADYIPSKAALDRAVIRSREPLQPIAPAVRSLGELTEQMCGTLVCVEDLQYAPEELADGTWAGYKRFIDADGREIHTYVRAYASFASGMVPAGRCSITGILQYDTPKARFILKLRDESDCVL